ncbi:MAG: 3-hydroxyacyl-CoA dehydrogenase family protein [Desulfovibrio sp.]|jgi:3-hydroxybutyryl-CoA dehydrogenase|nr:3-hydroxyacyl-CoA dehydrogenase family protein [Desulfovibrio sp.]
MQVKTIKTVACLGTGTMGHGVAFLAAKAGYTVKLFGRSQESIKRGLSSIDRAIALYEDNKLMPAGEGDRIRKNITGVTTLEEAATGADLVMESVAEVLEVKHDVFAKVEAVCPEKAIIATDTSGLDLEKIRTVFKHPERFLSIHFFTPPYLMPTVEVCPCSATLESVQKTAAQWVESIGNMPIELSTAVSGFVINRIQAAVLREALYIVEQGWASAETVDKAVANSLGRRYTQTGPIESAEMGGWDILGALLDELGDKLCAYKKAPSLVADLRAKGHLGLKTGQGYFPWPPERIQERRAARELSLIDFLRKDQEKKK